MIDLWVTQATHLSPAQSIVLLGWAVAAAFGLMYITQKRSE